MPTAAPVTCTSKNKQTKNPFTVGDDMLWEKQEAV